MIKSITGLAMRFFQANKFLAISSILSIMLSFSLIITMAVFADNGKQSLESEVKKMYGDMDLSVGYNPEQNKVIDSSLLEKITKREHVQEFSGVLVNRLQVNELNTHIYTVGVESDSLAKSRYHFSNSISDNEVALNQSLAKALNVAVGDRILIENKEHTVKEVLEDLVATGLTPDILLLSRSNMQQIVLEKTGVNNEATYVLVKAKPETDIIALANSIKQLDSEIRIDIAQENEFLKNNLQSLTVFMLVVAVLVLIVTSLFIVSNFDAFLYKYNNQMAIMRSIGATTGQLFKVLFIQYSVMNLVGASLGLFLARISNQFLQEWFVTLFSFESNVSNFNYKIAIMVTIIGLIIVQLFMLIPAYRTSKILPLMIVQQNEEIDFSNSRFKKRVGQALIISSIFFVFVGFSHSAEEPQPIYFLLAALLLIIGIFRLFPIYLTPMLNRVSPILKLLLGNVSYVAIRNVIPQVRKNTFIILIISVMMMIVVFGSTLFKTIQTNEEQFLKEQYPTSIVVKSRLGYNSTIDLLEIRETIRKTPGVEAASTLSTVSSARLKQGEKYISFNYALADLKQMQDNGLLPSTPSELSDNSIIITKNFADKYSLKDGDEIELGLYSEPEQRVLPASKVTVASVVEQLPGSPIEAYMDWENTTYKQKSIVFNKVFVSSIDEAAALAQLEKLNQQYPAQLQISSYNQSIEKSNQMFVQRWSIFIVVLVIILLCVIIGVFNSLLNNIQSKRKEFALLRTISVSTNGILRIILTQVIVYISIGLALGLVIGMLMTFVVGLIDFGTMHFDFQLVSLVSIFMLGMVFIIFIPFARAMGKQSITAELTRDNK
ncbi:ABC transporter permease [Paenibacillus sp. SC116]|uniref:FtsX-like permease family protein n=1 Tax=Paenibacillus sp. SC116 TaxID=2968986 RepID=UPI00215AE924|nr:ABC transporter permease [Paenibacillus sp. SC116]MCR8845076.1 ABC transporter permease [Paenibacillus sp. SC116]